MQELDVRPILREGGEPFDDIMAFVEKLPLSEGFRLLATFRPDPLLMVMAKKGFHGEARELPDKSWAVDFTRQD